MKWFEEMKSIDGRTAYETHIMSVLFFKFKKLTLFHRRDLTEKLGTWKTVEFLSENQNLGFIGEEDKLNKSMLLMSWIQFGELAGPKGVSQTVTAHRNDCWSNSKPLKFGEHTLMCGRSSNFLSLLPWRRLR